MRRLIQWLSRNAANVIIFLTLAAAVIYLVVTSVIDSQNPALTNNAFQIIVISSLLVILTLSVTTQKASKATFDQISGVRWTADDIDASKLLVGVSAAKVYLVAATLGRTAPTIRQIIRQSPNLNIEVFLPDPSEAGLPSHSTSEQSGNIANLGALKASSQAQLSIYTTKNFPSVSVGIFADSNDKPLGGYLGWYTTHNSQPGDDRTLNFVKFLDGRGHWGSLILRKGADAESNDLLFKAFAYVKSLSNDPTKTKQV